MSTAASIKPHVFADMLAALRAALDAEPGDGVPWTGPELTTPLLLATCSTVREDLSAEGLAYHAERGRDQTDVVLSAAIRLGIEQGLRMLAEDGCAYALLAELHVTDPDVREQLADRLRNPGGCKP